MLSLVRGVVGWLVIIIIRILRLFNVLLIKYEHGFGHQAWNIEYISRRHFRKTGRWPHLIAFQSKGNFIPNKALYNHHLQHGVMVFGWNSIPTRIYRKRGPRILDEVTRTSMNELHVNSAVEHDIPMAFPLSTNDKRNAEIILDKYGLSPYSYLCFQARDVKYKVVHSDKYGTGYLNSRKFEHARNASVETIYVTAEKLAAKGIKTVRIGAHPDSAVSSQYVIDYSNQRHDDGFGDMALMDSCKFFIGPNSGIWLFARAFNRPICLINVFPWPWINVPMLENCLTMPKKIWHREEKRLLRIDEMVGMEQRFSWKNYYQDSFFDELSVEFIENSEEEVGWAAEEMNARLDGSWAGPDYLVSDYLSEDNVAKRTRAKFVTRFVEENFDIFPKSVS